MKPNDADAHNNLGFGLSKIGRLEEATEHYKKALQLKPDNAETLMNLALIYAKEDRSAEAVAAGRKCLELARSKGQTALAKQIEVWLNSNYPNQ